MQDLGLGLDKRSVQSLLERVDELAAPPFIQTGYAQPLLVSINHLGAWAVPVGQSQDGDEPLAHVLPRRWLDIWGGQISTVWASAMRAVLGHVVLRPGITQASYDLLSARDPNKGSINVLTVPIGRAAVETARGLRSTGSEGGGA
jgi:hypothetical protein